MPRQHISRDIKARIPYLHYVKHFSVKEIERILGVRKTLIYDTLTNYQKYGVTYNPTAYTKFQRGRHRRLDSVDVQFIRALLNQELCMYLDELQDALMNRRNIYVSVPTLLRTLRWLHFSRKLISIKALEQNDQERSAYMNNIGDLITDSTHLHRRSSTQQEKSNLENRLVFDRQALHTASVLCSWPKIFDSPCSYDGWNYCA
jgi:transposase